MRKTRRHAIHSWRQFVNMALFDLSTKAGKITNALIASIIVAVVLSGMAHEIPAIDVRWHDEICLLEKTSIGIFLVEFLLRIACAHRPLGYLFSFEGLIDACAILPSLLLGQDTAGMRLLRLIKPLKLLLHLQPLRIIMHSLKEVSGAMLAVIAGILIISLTAGNLIFFLEPETFSSAYEGFWWSLITMSTVGYGDVVPHSTGGRILTELLVFIGIAMFAMVTALISVRISHIQLNCRACCACGAPVQKHFAFCPTCGEVQNSKPGERSDVRSDEAHADDRGPSSSIASM